MALAFKRLPALAAEEGVRLLAGSARCFAAKAGSGDVAPIAPMPANDYKRKAIIYKPSPPCAQYGYDQKVMMGGTDSAWKIHLPAQEMWANPLMGWSTSSDTAESAWGKMTFTTPEEAGEFLTQQGFEYEIDQKPQNFAPTYRPSRYSQYGDNFSTKRKGLPDLSHLPSNRK